MKKKTANRIVFAEAGSVYMFPVRSIYIIPLDRLFPTVRVDFAPFQICRKYFVLTSETLPGFRISKWSDHDRAPHYQS